MPAAFDTREEWLQTAALTLRNPVREVTGLEIPERVRIGVGFPRRGIRSNTLGECWSASASRDGIHEITIRITEHEPAQVLAVLLHELLHAALDNKHGHAGAFAKAHKAVGFEGSARESIMSHGLRLKLESLAEALGEYPGARGLTALDEGSGPKKQATRMIKCECETCGFTFRTTAKWIATAGGDDLECPHPSCIGTIRIDAPDTESEAA